MALFSEKGVIYTIITLGIVFAANAFGNQIKSAISSQNSEDELIRKYLLNESPLYGYNRPKIWIHTKYEYNARKWKSFYSRSSTDLNQPYIHLTIKSIINHCGDDFNVCLIDDDSFSQLIPGWKTNVSELPEPSRSYYRELGMTELLYIYGGLVVPNTFICMRNLIELYASGTVQDKPFVCETSNHYASINDRKKSFTANHKFMGAPKRSPLIRELVEYIKQRNENAHYSAEPEFFGYVSKWLNNEVARNHVHLVDGLYVGTKTKENKAVLIEDLLGEEPITFSKVHTFGIFIPGDELLKRCAYKWFSVLPLNELLDSNMIVTKYLIASLEEPKIKVEKPLQQLSHTVVAI